MSRRPAAAVLLCLALAGASACSAGSSSQVAPPASAPVSEPGAAASAPRVIEASYAGGKITGVEPRVPVALGEQVLLRVTSDVPEQIHVHGYDVSFDLAPGAPGEATFTADKPGAYEVELHEAGRPLFQLRVS